MQAWQKQLAVICIQFGFILTLFAQLVMVMLLIMMPYDIIGG